MAVSFTESATLELNDADVKRGLESLNRQLRELDVTAKKLAGSLARVNLDKLTRSLAKLNDIKGANSNLRELYGTLNNFSKLDNEAGALREINNEIARLRKSSARPINVDVNQRRTGRVPVTGGVGASDGGSGRGNNRLGSIYNEFPGNLPQAFNIGIAYLTVTGALQLAGAATQAALQGQAEETQRELIVSNSLDRATVERLARESLNESQRISLNRAEQIVSDLYLGGLRDNTLDQLAPEIVQQEGLATLLTGDDEATKQITKLANKVLNLSNSTEDVTRSLDIMSGVYAGAIVQGESFNAATSLAALQTAGLATTISGEGLVGFSLATDALGQRAGSSLARLKKELQTPLSQAGAGSGIAKGAVESLIGSGIRDTQGLQGEALAKFLSDPIKYIQTDLAKQLQTRGVDIDDRVAVTEALAKAGFATTSQRLVLEALSSIDESLKGRQVAGNILDGNAAEAAAANDLGAALKNLRAGFETFSAEALDPLFGAIAPIVSGFGDFLEYIGKTETALDDLAVVLGGVGAAAGGLYGLKKLVDVFNPLNASAAALGGSAASLDAAAAALIAAAEELGDGGGLDLDLDKKRRGRGRGGRIGNAVKEAADDVAKTGALQKLGKSLLKFGGSAAGKATGAVGGIIIPSELGSDDTFSETPKLPDITSITDPVEQARVKLFNGLYKTRQEFEELKEAAKTKSDVLLSFFNFDPFADIKYNPNGGKQDFNFGVDQTVPAPLGPHQPSRSSAQSLSVVPTSQPTELNEPVQLSEFQQTFNADTEASFNSIVQALDVSDQTLMSHIDQSVALVDRTNAAMIDTTRMQAAMWGDTAALNAEQTQAALEAGGDIVAAKIREAFTGVNIPINVPRPVEIPYELGSTGPV